MKKTFPDGSFIQIDGSEGIVITLGGIKGKILTTLSVELKKKEFEELVEGIVKQ